jgi:hypothetical protein
LVYAWVGVVVGCVAVGLLGIGGFRWLGLGGLLWRAGASLLVLGGFALAWGGL